MTNEQRRVQDAAEVLKERFPTAAHSYVATCRRQFAGFDGPQELAYYQRVADEAEALSELVADVYL